MHRTSVGTRIYISVLSIFFIFAAVITVFQYVREYDYKIGILNIKLQDYNTAASEALKEEAGGYEQAASKYIASHPMHGLRLTIIDTKGKVLYDNKYKAYAKMGNHLRRKEVREALKSGKGYDINRASTSADCDYFYSATYIPQSKLIIRTALPYGNSLTDALKADQHYIWFTLLAMAVLIFVLYRFVSRLSSNINKLRLFASRADHNESLETEDLAEFPADELGEIAERIIKIYKRLQKTKEEQHVLKRQLTQNIAHELKTPVASIQGYLETVLDNPNADAKMKEQFLQRCYAQCQRLASLLHDISTLNRLDDASELIGFEQVDVSRMVAGIAKDTALQFADRKMTFENRLPDGISMKGNSSMLYSIFRNLTDNAIAYSGDGTKVTLSVADDGKAWHFTFSDNGVGVPYEHLPRLFERFYRVDKGRSRKMGGTGLGLAIVKNAVLLHGGSIRVSNNPEGGLRFDFTLNK